MKLAPPNLNIMMKGKRIILKPISENEINEKYRSWLNDPEINEFLEAKEKEQRIEDMIDYVNALRAKPGCEIFGICTKGKHVGNIAITDFNPKRQGYAVYGIVVGDLKARLFGIGGDATVFIIDHIFKHPEIRRIQLRIASDNVKAQKTIEYLGFVKEGVMRQNIVLPNGKVNDGYVYGFLRDEWTANKHKVEHILKDKETLPLDSASHETWEEQIIRK